jgi:hypothetical protein
VCALAPEERAHPNGGAFTLSGDSPEHGGPQLQRSSSDTLQLGGAVGANRRHWLHSVECQIVSRGASKRVRGWRG